MQDTTRNESTGESRGEEHPGASPPRGGQRWAAVITHAVLPVFILLYILDALTVADYPSWSSLTSSAFFSLVIGLVVALPVWFFARNRPILRFQAIQTICWLVVVAVTAFILGLFLEALSLLVIAGAAAVSGYGVYRLLAGSSFRYPGAAFLVEVRQS